MPLLQARVAVARKNLCSRPAHRQFLSQHSVFVSSSTLMEIECESPLIYSKISTHSPVHFALALTAPAALPTEPTASRHVIKH
jgi:hypothetical protein